MLDRGAARPGGAGGRRGRRRPSRGSSPARRAHAREVGVLAAVADVVLAEPADRSQPPGRCTAKDSDQNRSGSAPTPQLAAARAPAAPGAGRRGRRGRPRSVAAGGRRGQVGHRARTRATSGSRRDGVGVGADQVGAGEAVDVEEDQHVGARARARVGRRALRAAASGSRAGPPRRTTTSRREPAGGRRRAPGRPSRRRRRGRAARCRGASERVLAPARWSCRPWAMRDDGDVVTPTLARSATRACTTPAKRSAGAWPSHQAAQRGAVEARRPAPARPPSPVRAQVRDHDRPAVRRQDAAVARCSSCGRSCGHDDRGTAGGGDLGERVLPGVGDHDVGVAQQAATGRRPSVPSGRPSTVQSQPGRCAGRARASSRPAVRRRRPASSDDPRRARAPAGPRRGRGSARRAPTRLKRGRARPAARPGQQVAGRGAASSPTRAVDDAEPEQVRRRRRASTGQRRRDDRDAVQPGQQRDLDRHVDDQQPRAGASRSRRDTLPSGRAARRRAERHPVQPPAGGRRRGAAGAVVVAREPDPVARPVARAGQRGQAGDRVRQPAGAATPRAVQVARAVVVDVVADHAASLARRARRRAARSASTMRVSEQCASACRRTAAAVAAAPRAIARGEPARSPGAASRRPPAVDDLGQRAAGDAGHGGAAGHRLGGDQPVGLVPARASPRRPPPRRAARQSSRWSRWPT